MNNLIEISCIYCGNKIKIPGINKIKIPSMEKELFIGKINQLFEPHKCDKCNGSVTIRDVNPFILFQLSSQ
jgi:hypothetical protein